MSGRLAVAPLSDGRLQLWAVGPTTHTLFSMWQVSVIPTEPWTSLRLFNPNPSAVENTSGVIYSIRAGHSPGGLVQLWVPAFFQAKGSLGPYGTMTTWKTTADSDAGWLPWQPFVTPSIAPGLLGVEQLADGRMELFAEVGAEGPLPLFTSWKESSDPIADWSPWKGLNPQLSGGVTGGAFIESLSDGRLQAWAIGSQAGFYSSWQTSGPTGSALGHSADSSARHSPDGMFNSRSFDFAHLKMWLVWDIRRWEGSAVVLRARPTSQNRDVGAPGFGTGWQSTSRLSVGDPYRLGAGYVWMWG